MHGSPTAKQPNFSTPISTTLHYTSIAHIPADSRHISLRRTIVEQTSLLCFWIYRGCMDAQRGSKGSVHHHIAYFFLLASLIGRCASFFSYPPLFGRDCTYRVRLGRSICIILMLLAAGTNTKSIVAFASTSTPTLTNRTCLCIPRSSIASLFRLEEYLGLSFRIGPC